MAASTLGSTVDERAVYLTAGAVLPSVVQEILHSLLNDNFQTAYGVILKVGGDTCYATGAVGCGIIIEILMCGYG